MNQSTSNGFAYAQTFSIGSVLSRTLEIIAAKPVVFFGLMALPLIPNMLILAMSSPDSIMRGGTNFSFGSFVLPLLVSLFLGLIIQGAVAFAVYQVLTEDAASIAACLTRGFSRVLSLFLASLLMMLCLWIGFMLLIIPGIILMTMFFVAIPACTVERLGPVACLNRSAELTKGSRLKIFGLIIIYFVVAFIFNLLTGIIVGLITSSPTAVNLISMIVGLLPSTFFIVMIGMSYFDLRVMSEGVDVGSLSNIFD